MILHVQQLHEVEDLCLDVDGQACKLPSDVGIFMAPVHLDARIRKVKEDISIEGRISTHVEMNCARCLKPYNETIDDAFEVIYRPKPEEPEDVDEIELDETDLDVMYYEGNVIDVSELLRDQLLLLLPVKPLCKPDCAGLCPSCGKDLNEGVCECPKHIEPRLAVLKQFLNKIVKE